MTEVIAGFHVLVNLALATVFLYAITRRAEDPPGGHNAGD